MNDIPVWVLFDSEATRAFVSLALSKKFPESSSMLEYRLEVEIADEWSAQASKVHRGCVLRI